MTDISTTLEAMLEKHPASPFLFVGSGFARRYLGIEDWRGLLERFCVNIRPFHYYFAKSNGNLPLTATYIAEDFYEWWWSSSETNDSRLEFSASVESQSDPLKFEISKYLSEKGIDLVGQSEWADEIGHLAKVNVDGIITTNWDTLIEEIFPDYRAFVGQDELLFANPQSIGEIYKIHGSVNSPKSLVLTSEDYLNFERQNPYLAAKLVTIFVEHPIIFIGYSINDPHIKSIIMAIAGCLSQDRIAKFEENLFFVQRLSQGALPSIERITMQSEHLSISMTVVRVDSFSDVYNALSATKRKIPVKLLRFFREQMFELTRSTAEVDKKLAVVDYEEIENADEVEFVVGLGVAKRREEFDENVEKRTQDALDRKGYAGVAPGEIFVDCVSPESKFEAGDLLEAAYPGYARSHRTFFPVFRYLQLVGIDTAEKLKASKYEGAKKIVLKMDGKNYGLQSYRKRFDTAFAGLSSSEIIDQASSPTEALLMLGFQVKGTFESDVVGQFLRTKAEEFQSEPYATAYRKLVCLYDKFSYGF